MSVQGDYPINLTGSGDTTVVTPSSASQFVRVLHYHLSTDLGGTTVTFKSGSEVKDVCYATQAAGGGIAVPEYQDGVFDCNPGDALVVNNSAAKNVGGAVKYRIMGKP